jgi:hypothetical protein
MNGKIYEYTLSNFIFVSSYVSLIAAIIAAGYQS